MEAGPLDRMWSAGPDLGAGPGQAAGSPSAGRSPSARSPPASPGWSPPTCSGTTTPFFAPIAAVVSLGTSYGQRLRRVAEVTVGVAIGVFVADLLVAWLGSGWWQLDADRGAGDVGGVPARRRPALRHPGRGAVDRGEPRWCPDPGRGVHPLDRRADRRRGGAGRGHGGAGGAAAPTAGAGGRGDAQDRRAAAGRGRGDGRRRGRAGR